MNLYRSLAALLLLAFAGVVHGQQNQVNCTPGTPCNVNAAPTVFGTGDPAWSAFGKLNANETQLFGMFGPSSHLKSTGNAASSDVYGLWSGSCTATSYLRGDGACSAIYSPASSSAALYVTTVGNDSLDCLSWLTACATIQHAISLLPANGGLVEVGYGTFPGNIIIAAQSGVRIRGRGIAHSTSVQDTSQALEAHPTLITGNVVIAAGDNGGTESVWSSGTVLEDLAISTSNTLYGAAGDCLTLASPNVNIRRVAFDRCGNRGVAVLAAVVFTATPSGTSGTLDTVWSGATNTYTLTFSDGTTKSVTLTNNSSAVSWSGSISSNPLTTALVGGANFFPAVWFVTFEDSRFIKNGANGIQGAMLASDFIGNNDFDGNTATAVDFTTIPGTQEIRFFGGIIQRNFANTSGGLSFNGTALTMIGTHIEANYGALANQNNGEINIGTGTAIILGCQFVPATYVANTSGTLFGITLAGSAGQTSVIGANNVIGAAQYINGFVHAGEFQIGATNSNLATNFPGVLFGNSIGGGGGNLLGGFGVGPTGGLGIQSTNAYAMLGSGGPRFDSVCPYTITSAGSTVTLRPDVCTVHRIWLNGGTVTTTNLTTSNLSNGQEIEVHWVQDGTGGRTYAWPAQFQNNPAAGPFTTTNAAANVEDIYTFRCIYSSVASAIVCQETSRALGVGGSTASPGTFTSLTAAGTVNLNASNNAATNIGTGTTTSAVSIGGTANAVNVGAPLNLSTAGNLSANSWTTNGLVLSGTARTLTDSTGSGTIPQETAAALPAYTIGATNTGVTVTNLSELYLPVPIAGTNVTATNLWSLNTAGNIRDAGTIVTLAGASLSGGTVSLNANSNNGTNIGTGTTTSQVNIGNSANIVVFGPNMTTNGTAFTAATATGCSTTNGTPGTISGGPQGGTMVGNSAGTGCTFVITVNGATGATASHAWTCYGSDETTGIPLGQKGTSTVNCTLFGTVNATTDTIAFHIDGN